MSEKLLCEIFKSSRKDEMYLYVDKRKGMETVPEALMETFGSQILEDINFSPSYLFPVDEDVGSDSAFLDNVVELLTHCSNRDIAEVMLSIIPEAWQND